MEKFPLYLDGKTSKSHHFKVRNFRKTKFCDFTIFWQIPESFEPRNKRFVSTREKLIPAEILNFGRESFFSWKFFFL